MKTYKTTGGGKRVRFPADEVTRFRAALLILMSDANAAEEKVKETVRRTNGELGREQLNYWQCYQKTLRHVAHRIGLGFKQELFHRALAILTAPPAES